MSLMRPHGGAWCYRDKTSLQRSSHDLKVLNQRIRRFVGVLRLMGGRKNPV